MDAAPEWLTLLILLAASALLILQLCAIVRKE